MKTKKPKLTPLQKEIGRRERSKDKIRTLIQEERDRHRAALIPLLAKLSAERDILNALKRGEA